MKRLAQLALFLGLLLSSCQTQPKTVKVAASPTPHAEILLQLKDDLKKEGVNLEIIEVDDYAIPNRLLAEKVVDANFFQHIPYLEAENNNFGYDFAWIAKVHIEPIAIYSKKFSSLDSLPLNATVAVPSDPSNETRALHLLADKGLITLGKKSSQFLTILDIEENPKKLKFNELDAALLPRVLKDVDIAVIPGNYALQGKLSLEDALAVEAKDSPYANVLVVRASDVHRGDLQKLAYLLNSEKMREFINERYKGRLIPAF